MKYIYGLKQIMHFLAKIDTFHILVSANIKQTNYNITEKNIIFKGNGYYQNKNDNERIK